MLVTCAQPHHGTAEPACCCIFAWNPHLLTTLTTANYKPTGVTSARQATALYLIYTTALNPFYTICLQPNLHFCPFQLPTLLHAHTVHLPVAGLQFYNTVVRRYKRCLICRSAKPPVEASAHLSYVSPCINTQQCTKQGAKQSVIQGLLRRTVPCNMVLHMAATQGCLCRAAFTGLLQGYSMII